MARFSIIVCDLCPKISKEELPYSLALQKGKGKDKEVTKAEICSSCFSTLIEKIESDFDLNQLPQNNEQVMQIGEQKVIADGETLVPSNLDNVAKLPGRIEQTCGHEKTSFEPPNNVKCKECGDEWKI